MALAGLFLYNAFKAFYRAFLFYTKIYAWTLPKCKNCGKSKATGGVYEERKCTTWDLLGYTTR